MRFPGLALAWAGIALALGFEGSLQAEPAVATHSAQQLLELKVADNPGDIFAWNRLCGIYLDLLRSTGDMSYLAAAEKAARTSQEQVSGALNSGGLLARGRVEHASHRFTAALATAKEYREMKAANTAGWELQGLAELELGQYDAAGSTFASIAKSEELPSAGTEARLARLDFIYGRREQAKLRLEHALQLAQQADQPDTAMLAWCEVQLGELAFRGGDFDKAEQHYRAALKVDSAWYPAREHIAELLGAQGKYDESIAAYKELLSHIDRPDLCQALGDLYKYTKREAEAVPWFGRRRGCVS